MIYIVLTLIAISGLSKGIQDQLMFHWGKSWTKNLKPNFWNPAVSWKNKYKNGNPEDGPKFKGSTTIFVSITDAWHFFGMLRENANRLAIIFALASAINYKIEIYFVIWVILFIIFTISFKLLYKTDKHVTT